MFLRRGPDHSPGPQRGPWHQKLHSSDNKRIFSRAVLEMQRSGGLHEMGYPKWQLVLCLLVVYSMLYLSLFKGVKSSGTYRRLAVFILPFGARIIF